MIEMVYVCSIYVQIHLYFDLSYRFMPISGDLEVFAAGNQQNIQVISEFGTPIQDSNITLIRGTSDSVSAVFPSGISITFSRVSEALATTFNGPVRFVNRTKGLLGTWNDDPSDDFTTPYGTVLSADATPQQIHYDFGLKCKFSRINLKYGATTRTVQLSKFYM